MSGPRICVVGSANLDLVVTAERAPDAGETVTGRAVSTTPGGKGANQAVAAARAGGRVSLVAAVGDDDAGRRLREHYRDAGLDVDGVRTVAVPTGTAVITVDDAGENRIVVVPGANAELGDLTDADRDRIARSEVVLLQLEVPLALVLATARHARTVGTRVVLTPAPAQPLPRDLLACVDVLVPNEHEARLLTDVGDPSRAAARLRADGAAAVVVTRGAAGALHVGPDGEQPIPAVTAREVVDSTGAGDAFAAWLAVGLGEGRAVPEALHRAAAAGSLAVERPGATAPTRAEVEERLAGT